MTKRPLKNVAASVRERLLNKAKKDARPFNEVLQYFALERFLYRLSVSPHASKFVLKGALMLSAWRAPYSRPTMDIDLLGKLKNDVEGVAAVVREVCAQEVEPDGLHFDPTSVAGERIAEDAIYEGVRVRLAGTLGTARVVVQIDVGFGDAVVPAASATELPAILDFPPPKLAGYSRESAIAEKFHAMVKLGTLNSRMKDFFDIWFLSRHFDFDGATLATAIRTTFANRETEVPASPVALAPSFATEPGKEAQWRAFLRVNRLKASEGLGEVTDALAGFLGPLARSLAAGEAFAGTWRSPGPWGAP